METPSKAMEVGAVGATLAVGAVMGVAVSLAWRHLASRRSLDKACSSLGAITKTGTPHPSWKPHTTTQHLPYKGGFRTIDPAGGGSMYPLMISCVVPRPIALVSSLGEDGICNLAPFSYFTVVNHNPPTVVFSCSNPTRGPKDTLANVLSRRECVVHVMSDWFVESANHTCDAAPTEVDEMDVSKMTKILSEKVAPPRIAEAAVAMECKVIHTQELRKHDGDLSCTMVTCEVVLLHVHEGVFTTTPNSGSPCVDFEKLRPVSRLGGISYGFVNKYFNLARPDHAR